MGGVISRLAVPGIADLPAYQPGRDIDEVRQELGLERVFKLASNENPLGPSPRIRDFLAAAPDLARYPDSAGHALRRDLADFHGVDPAQITLGNGSNEVLELVARCVVTSAHEVMYSDPAFVVYRLATCAVGAAPVVVPARNYGHDLDAMAAAAGERTRLLFIDNPGNPTGAWIDGKRLHSFLEAMPEDLVVVVDEAYHEYAAALQDDYASALELLPHYPNLVVTRTFSKAYGLAGLRVGYALSHPELADLMNRVRQPFNVNALAQGAARIALEDQAHLRRCVALNTQGMGVVTAALRELDLPWIKSSANFVSFEVPRPAAEVYQELLQQGVIVRPIAEYGFPRHLRATIGLAEENAAFIDALRRALA